MNRSWVTVVFAVFMVLSVPLTLVVLSIGLTECLMGLVASMVAGLLLPLQAGNRPSRYSGPTGTGLIGQTGGRPGGSITRYH